LDIGLLLIKNELDPFGGPAEASLPTDVIGLTGRNILHRGTGLPQGQMSQPLSGHGLVVLRDGIRVAL
jgi:hypothetical protein